LQGEDGKVRCLRGGAVASRQPGRRPNRNRVSQVFQKQGSSEAAQPQRLARNSLLEGQVGKRRGPERAGAGRSEPERAEAAAAGDVRPGPLNHQLVSLGSLACSASTTLLAFASAFAWWLAGLWANANRI